MRVTNDPSVQIQNSVELMNKVMRAAVTEAVEQAEKLVRVNLEVALASTPGAPSPGKGQVVDIEA